MVVLSEPASYTLSRRWLCSLGWLRRCSPDRRLQWYSHWWGSHSFQRQLHNRTKHVSHINYPLPSQHFIFIIRKKKLKSVLPTFWFNHIVVPNFQSLRYCEWSAKAIHCWWLLHLLNCTTDAPRIWCTEQMAERPRDMGCSANHNGSLCPSKK